MIHPSFSSQVIAAGAGIDGGGAGGALAQAAHTIDRADAQRPMLNDQRRLLRCGVVIEP
jgi:hypothetical protein